MSCQLACFANLDPGKNIGADKVVMGAHIEVQGYAERTINHGVFKELQIEVRFVNP